MSSDATWVRARDGAIYLAPQLVDPCGRGVVCFDADAPTAATGELVTWIDDVAGTPSPRAVLDAVLGADGWDAERLQLVGIAQRQRSENERAWALVWAFALSRRIPRPTSAKEVQRFATRLRRALRIDPPAHARDAFELEIPQPG